MMTLKCYLEKIVTGEYRGWRTFPTVLILAPLSVLYRLILWYKYYRITSHKLPVPVISVGNLTAGGTGKTPTVIALIEFLQTSGYHPAILTRGYGGTLQQDGFILTSDNIVDITVRETGDEPLLLAESLSNVPIAIGRDRVAMAERTLREFSQVDLFVLDDGFQQWKLFRDFDLVLIDALRPFANGHVLPWGLLREPLNALKRADGIILTRTDKIASEVLSDLKVKIAKLSDNVPIYTAKVDNSEFSSVFSEDTLALGERAAAITAIGNYAQFESALRQTGIKLDLFENFVDHHFWEESEIQELLTRMHSLKLHNLIVTGKDAVKLTKFRCIFEQADVKLYILNLRFIPDEKLLNSIMEFLKK